MQILYRYNSSSKMNIKELIMLIKNLNKIGTFGGYLKK